MAKKRKLKRQNEENLKSMNKGKKRKKDGIIKKIRKMWKKMAKKKKTAKKIA